MLSASLLFPPVCAGEPSELGRTVGGTFRSLSTGSQTQEDSGESHDAAAGGRVDGWGCKWEGRGVGLQRGGAVDGRAEDAGGRGKGGDFIPLSIPGLLPPLCLHPMAWQIYQSPGIMFSLGNRFLWIPSALRLLR